MSAAAARFYASKDLRAFIDRAKETGGSANLYFAGQAAARCFTVSYGGRVRAEQMMIQSSSPGFANDTVRLEAFRQWMEPCAGFEARPFHSQEDMNDLYQRRRTATEGPIKRLADAATLQDQKNHIRASLESGDPELAAAVTMRMAYLADGRPKDGASADEWHAYGKRTMLEDQSWSIAMCELGANCGRSTTVWFAACMSTGKCGEGNYVDGYRNWYEATEKDLAAIRARRDQIVTAVRARDWEALGLAP